MWSVLHGLGDRVGSSGARLENEAFSPEADETLDLQQIVCVAAIFPGQAKVQELAYEYHTAVLARDLRGA